MKTTPDLNKYRIAIFIYLSKVFDIVDHETVQNGTLLYSRQIFGLIQI